MCEQSLDSVDRTHFAGNNISTITISIVLARKLTEVQHGLSPVFWLAELLPSLRANACRTISHESMCTMPPYLAANPQRDHDPIVILVTTILGSISQSAERGVAKDPINMGIDKDTIRSLGPALTGV